MQSVNFHKHPELHVCACNERVHTDAVIALQFRQQCPLASVQVTKRTDAGIASLHLPASDRRRFPFHFGRNEGTCKSCKVRLVKERLVTEPAYVYTRLGDA